MKKLKLLAALLLFNYSLFAQWTDVGSPDFTGWGAFPNSLALNSSGVPYFAYDDWKNTPAAPGLTVMTYNGTNWVTLGGTNVTGGQIESPSLVINSSGTPYVAFSDFGSASGYSGKATVMKYITGTGWVNVGSPDFSAGTANYPSLAFDASGTPYVAYADGSTTPQWKATVMKYNGTSWVNVGSAGFSADRVDYISLKFNSSGTPYVAYKDAGNSNKATVMKYNGTSWVNVGSAGFSAGQVDNTTLAIDANGIVYVGYEDESTSQNGMTVMKYNGSWVNVGNPQFSAGGAFQPTLTLDANGNLYVAYADANGGSYNATVMKYNGTSWITVGSAGFSPGAIANPSLAISSNGIPYIAYADETDSSKAIVMQFCSPYISSALASEYCAGSSLTVPYATLSGCGSYNSGNVFTAQLSDASGSFASPTSIGTLTSTSSSGNISATIPTTCLPGTNYRMRIVASNPAVTGVDNGVNIAITNSCGTLEFATGDRVTIANNAAYNFGTGNFTLEAWVRLPTTAENFNPSAIISNRSSATNGLLFAVNSSTSSTSNMNQLLLQINGTNYTSNTFTAIDDNNCYHIAVTRTSGAIKFYLNGTSVTSGSPTNSSSISTTSPLYIGYDAVYGGSDSYLGNIDDVRLWNIAESGATIASNMSLVVPDNSTGLVGYWDFNESGQSVYDQSSKANNGYLGTTTSSDAQDPTRVNGVKCFIPALETGLTFNGPSGKDRATVPNNSAYNFGSGTFTLEAWVNIGTQTSTAPGIVSDRTSTADGFLFSTLSGNDLLLQMGGSNYYSHGFTNIEGTGCHHIAVANDGAGNLQFYLDGSALGGTIPCTTSVSSTGSMYIGYDIANNTTLNGSINELRIWDVTRTATDIANNLTTVFPSGTSNLVGYWKLNESADEIIYDQSSTANHGYLGTNSIDYDTDNPTRENNICNTGGERLSAINSTIESTPIDSSSFNISNPVKVYPNPFNSETNIVVSGNGNGQADIRISDLQGTTLYTSQLNFNKVYSIGQELKTGMYFVEVTREGNKPEVFKIIKLE